MVAIRLRTRWRQRSRSLIHTVEEVDRRQAVYDELYQNNVVPVFRYIFGMVGDRAVAEDLTQDVFLVACERLHQVRDPDRLRGWLFAIAANITRKHLRRRRSWRWLPHVAAELGASHGDGGPGIDESSVAIQQVLGSLSEDDRHVLLLVGYLGFSAAEAAAVLNISIAATQKRWQRACARFRAAMEGD